MIAAISPEESLSNIFSLLAQPARLQILLVIGNGEACVCHLKAVLGQRQPYISQQLMVLREAGLVIGVREGRNIFYRLADPAVLELVHTAARLAHLDLPEYQIPEISGCAYRAAVREDQPVSPDGRAIF